MVRPVFIIIIVLLLAIGVLLFATDDGPTSVEEITDSWAIEYYSPRGVDGPSGRYLVRRTGSKTRQFSGYVLEARYVGDDYVVYVERALYGVCGEGPPVYVATTGDDAPPLASDSITVGQRTYSIADIKAAAQNVSEESAGGRWIIQKQAFPIFVADMPQFSLIRTDSVHGRYLVSGEPVHEVRNLDDDCLLYVYRGIAGDPSVGRPGSYGTGVQCGRRESIFLGAVEHPSAIQAAGRIRIDGDSVAVDDLKARALSQRNR